MPVCKNGKSVVCAHWKGDIWGSLLTSYGRGYADAAARRLLPQVMQPQEGRVHDALLVDVEAVVVGLLESSAFVENLIQEVGGWGHALDFESAGEVYTIACGHRPYQHLQGRDLFCRGARAPS